MKDTVISWSCGGGTQSAAIGVLIGEGVLPVPDLMAIVDTGRERQETWDYMKDHINPYLRAKVGREVVIVPHTFARVDVYDKDGLTIMPAYTKEGRLGAFCSGEWKRDAMERWLRQQGVKDCVQWLGFSVDEMKRATGKAHRPWCRPSYPLIDKRMNRHDCIRLVVAAGLPSPPKSRCWCCLAGDTEVVTRDGIFPIRELAGRDVELLVPAVGRMGGLASNGSFIRAPVRSFGTQQLWKLTLRCRRARKIVYATAEHRWMLAPHSQWCHVDSLWRTTETLQPGDRLKCLHPMPIVKEFPLPLALMQGFVFGDGNTGEGDRPASMFIYKGKDEAMLPLFSLCNPRPGVKCSVVDGKEFENEGWLVYGLPRSWKELPDIRESRSFLLGWLAGWFAADGTVDATGRCTLYNVDRKPLEFARSLCTVLGIRTAGIKHRLRKGVQGIVRPLHCVDLSVHDVPPEFFRLHHHRQRAERKQAGERRSREPWRVDGVEATDRVEEVFCATVEGVGAFGLADGLMTGNCPHQNQQEWQQVRADPVEWAKAVALDEDVRANDPTERGELFLHASRVPLALADLSEPEVDMPLFRGCQDSGCFT